MVKKDQDERAVCAAECEEMMLKLERLTAEDFAVVWEIMEESFPVDERRNRSGQEEVLKNPYYHLYGYRQRKEVVAFLAVWEFDVFTFIEHFAVKQTYRNGGLGAELLGQLLEPNPLPVILEAEPPLGELQERRIRFYERNGFVLNPYEYVQPAMSAEGKKIPLDIMSYPRRLSVGEYETMRDILYRIVYHV